jgi:D-threo-aldose 1-dehydrogenase
VTAILPTRMIGRTGLVVTELGVGTAPLGNLYRQVTSDDAGATMRAALSAGFRYVDTAPYYGFGLSERRVGDAVRGVSDVVVSTKAGRLLGAAPDVRDARERHGFHSPMPFEPEYDYSYDGIMRSWEASLQRLGLARVDILLVHDIGRLTHGERHQASFDQLTSGGGFKALEELRAGRAIRAFGLGVNEVAVCHEAMKHTHLDVVLLAGRYTLLEQEALDDLFPACAVSGTCVIVGGPYNSGILASGTRGHETVYYDYGIASQSVIERVRNIESCCDRHGISLACAALQFPLAHPLVGSVIPGLGSAQRIKQTLDLYRHEIPDAFWEDLKANGLLRADAPVPARAVRK